MTNNTNSAMDYLKKEGSIRVNSGMIVVYPQSHQEETLNVSNLAPKFNGCYATNNSTVCFVSDNEVFVTPYTRSTLHLLVESGFKEKYFFVPFSDGDYPKSEVYKWNSLRKRACLSYTKCFTEDCIAYCNAHGIGTLSDEILKNCFQMPATGVKIRQHNYEGAYYPIINSNCLDCIAVEKIGKYSTNNGRVVFVYRDGKTYVTKGYKIVSALREAGYTECGLFVPFSNGEQILDFTLKSRWESITKVS